jgi:hypothetical protein
VEPTVIKALVTNAAAQRWLRLMHVFFHICDSENSKLGRRICCMAGLLQTLEKEMNTPRYSVMAGDACLA